MKKLLLIVFTVLVMFGCCNIAGVCMEELSDDNKQVLNTIISEYKKGHYLTCITMLKDFTSQNANIAAGWYYLGNSYMNVAMTKEANEAFDKVIQLNTIPRLTSYAVQAQVCMNNPIDCKYEIVDNADDVTRLVADPNHFFEKLINGECSDNIHPQAQAFILTETARMEASQNKKR